MPEEEGPAPWGVPRVGRGEETGGGAAVAGSSRVGFVFKGLSSVRSPPGPGEGLSHHVRAGLGDAPLGRQLIFDIFSPL